MAANVLKHSIALFLILALDLVPVACGLLRRDQQDTEAQCASDVALTTFKAQKDAAQSFCSAYLPNTLQTITALSITTIVVASTTVTAQQISEPTLDFTVMADYETITTTTVACPATAIPAVAGVSGVAALTTGVLPIGVGHGRVKVRDVGDIGDVAAPTSINTVAIPPYASAFQPAQISSVCLCLVGVPTTATTHQLATVTSFANIFTTTIINLGDVPIVNYVTFGATRKLIVTECA